MAKDNDLKRWMIMNKVFLVILALLVLFAWMDTRQLVAMKTIDAQWQRGDLLWPIFWGVQLPAVNLLWYGVLIAVALIWYLMSKDKSESLALFAAPAIMIFFGTQDLFYFVMSPIDKLLPSMGCWANRIGPVNFLSHLFGETCPSNLVFLASGFIGLGLGYLAYVKLQKVKKW